MELSIDSINMTEEEFEERIAAIQEEVQQFEETDEVILALCKTFPDWVNNPNKGIPEEELAEEPSFLEIAIAIASAAHMGQRDPNGEPYILHCLRVMEEGSNDIERAIRVLHDVLEDTDVTAYELLMEGIPFEVVEAVVAMSHLRGDDYFDYIRNQVLPNELARGAKIDDIHDNLLPSRVNKLPEKDRVRLRNKYEKALKILLTEVPSVMDWNS